MEPKGKTRPNKAGARPNQAMLDDGAPYITLGGEMWPIPRLAIKQARVIVPLLCRVLPKLAEAEGKREEVLAVIFSSDNFDALCAVVFHALLRAHPDLTIAEFNDKEFTPNELIAAWPLIATQTGLMAEETPKKTPG